MAWIGTTRETTTGKLVGPLVAVADKFGKGAAVFKSNISTYVTDGVYQPPGRGTGSYPVGGP